MKTRTPTLQEAEELVSFLPQLYVEGFTPIKRWHGRTKSQDSFIQIPFPEYEEVIKKFFRVASRECWVDYDYLPEEVSQMLKDDDLTQTADLDQIKTMLTYCNRGERFCDGHWGTMIEAGYVRRLLQRLSELLTKYPFSN